MSNEEFIFGDQGPDIPETLSYSPLEAHDEGTGDENPYPSTQINSSLMVPGHLEPDQFVINDVILRIPPEQINVDKVAMNYEWRTLRTRSAQKIKSGFSTATVSFSAIFNGPAGDFSQLVRLVAGLRATPFCVIYNSHLEKTLGKPDNSKPLVPTEEFKYAQFQPIMLALSSMRFETLGHEGKPGCIRGSFELHWFNYFPFSSVIAFKCGPNLDVAGRPDQSWIWEEFYKPFLTVPAGFPHGYDQKGIKNRTTTFLWREFMTLPKGSTGGLESSLQLLDIFRKNPGFGLASLKKVLMQATSSQKKDIIEINDGLYDTLWRNLALGRSDDFTKGVLGQLSDDQKQMVAQGNSGEITALIGEILTPIIKRIGAKESLEPEDKEELDRASALLASRLKRLKDSQVGEAVVDKLAESGFVKLLSTEQKIKSKEVNQSNGVFDLYGRKRRLKITHQLDPLNDTLSRVVIERIVVQWDNILATIPMIGYHYPTMQHLGSMNANISISLNAWDKVGDINRMYDQIEMTALKYKQLPQGLTNLYIQNDFLNMLGLDEFVTERITTQTHPVSPGRSLIELELSIAGVTSKNTSEKLQQEFIPGSTDVMQAIWKIIKSKLRQRINSKNKYQPTDKEFYFFETINVPRDAAHIALANYIDEARDILNGLIETLLDSITSGQGVFSNGIAAYSVASNLKEVDDRLGFIPGWSMVWSLAEKYYNACRSQSWIGQAPDKMGKKGTSQLDIQRDLDATRKAIAVTTDPNQMTVLQKKEERLRQQLGDYLTALQRIGVPTYQLRMRALLDKVMTGPLVGLPEFASIGKMIAKMGLNKGQMAYPDFRPQLSSILQSNNETDLMQIEPDCYFWYPMLDGGTASDLYGIVDPEYIHQAKLQSVEDFKNAKGETGKFFEHTYLQRLGKPGTNQLPKSTMEADLRAAGAQKIQMYQDLYRTGGDAGRIPNGTKGEEITLRVAPEGSSKAPANWYPDNPGQIESEALCFHSADINDLWNGYTGSTNQAPSGASAPIPVTPTSTSTTPIPKGQQYKYRVLNAIPAFMAERGITNCEPKEAQEKYLQLFEAVKQIINPETGKPYGKFWGATKLHSGWGGISLDFGPPGYAEGGARSMMMGPPTQNKVAYFAEIGRIAESMGFYWAGRSPSFKGKQNFREWVELPQKAYAAGKTYKYPWITQLQPLPGPPTKEGKPRAGTDGQGGMGDFMHIEWAASHQVGKRAKRSVPSSPAPISNVTSSGGKSVSATMGGVLPAAIDEFQRDIYNSQGPSLIRAYPTFKLYFVEDDSNERKRLGFDDFFSYNAVQSIRVVKSREVPADLCEIYITNVSGILSNRKYKQTGMDIEKSRAVDNTAVAHDATGARIKETDSVMKKDTKDENPIASFLLQEGANIHLRLGYSSDPDRLDTVFNGIVTEIQFSESEDLICLIAQGHAIELIQDIKGIEKPDKRRALGVFGWTFWGFPNSATTARIIEEMLCAPELIHFGRWKPRIGGATMNRDLLTERWTWKPQPQDDNIFAPKPSQDMAELSNGIIFDSLQYIIYQTTIWDILQEMTMRHPNMICSVVPYQDRTCQRSTVFFGLPNQFYFAKAPSIEEQQLHQKLLMEARQKVMNTPNKILEIGNIFSSYLTTKIQSRLVEKITYRNTKELRFQMSTQHGSIKPFRNYHLITSSHHIIANNITANARDVANTIVVKYLKEFSYNPLSIGKGIVKAATGSKLSEAFSGSEDAFTLKLDAALPPEETRTFVGSFINVTNVELARRYALALLLKHTKHIYKGSIIILGNARIKPYDVVYILDEYSDMVGAVEVREVQHMFDEKMGFVTEIFPDMLCAAAEWSLMSSAQALGVVMEGYCHRLFGAPGQGSYSGGLAFLPWTLAGHGAKALGGFLGQKILTYTQLAHPIIMQPLMHHGKPFAGGVPIKKLPLSVWQTVMGHWDPENDAGVSQWIEDKQNELSGWFDSTQSALGNLSNFAKNE